MKEEELHDGVDQLLESLWYGPPLMNDRELKYDRHQKCGELLEKNNENLDSEANLWCWDTWGSTYK